jgi:anti-anti-sigma regulatory factor
MLRLTRVNHKDSGVTFVVEGRIVGEWSDLLARECAGPMRERRTVCLDLAGVTYVDARGVQRVRRLERRGVRLLRTTRLLAGLLGVDGHE